jgi:hypothetical protein
MLFLVAAGFPSIIKGSAVAASRVSAKWFRKRVRILAATAACLMLSSTLTWWFWFHAERVALSVCGPPAALVGDELQFVITVKNISTTEVMITGFGVFEHWWMSKSISFISCIPEWESGDCDHEGCWFNYKPIKLASRESLTFVLTCRAEKAGSYNYQIYAYEQMAWMKHKFSHATTSANVRLLMDARQKSEI